MAAAALATVVLHGGWRARRQGQQIGFVEVFRSDARFAGWGGQWSVGRLLLRSCCESSLGADRGLIGGQHYTMLIWEDLYLTEVVQPLPDAAEGVRARLLVVAGHRCSGENIFRELFGMRGWILGKCGNVIFVW